MAGTLLAFWAVRAVVALSAGTVPRIDEVRVDRAVVGFGFLLALFSGMLFGALPAVRASRRPPQPDLQGVRGIVAHGHGVRSTLVIAEVGLALVLVIGAGLMARSFLGLRNVDPGFDPDHVAVLTVQYNTTGLSGAAIGERLAQRRVEIIVRLRKWPDVTRGVGDGGPSDVARS